MNRRAFLMLPDRRRRLDAQANAALIRLQRQLSIMQFGASDNEQSPES